MLCSQGDSSPWSVITDVHIQNSVLVASGWDQLTGTINAPELPTDQAAAGLHLVPQPYRIAPSSAVSRLLLLSKDAVSINHEPQSQQIMYFLGTQP